MPPPISDGKKELLSLAYFFLHYCCAIVIGFVGLYGVLLVSPYLVEAAKAGNSWPALLFFNLIGTVLVLVMRRRRHLVLPIISGFITVLLLSVVLAFEALWISEYGQNSYPPGMPRLLRSIER